MTNVLFIAYHFAPLNSGGTFRSLYFVKYLRDFGINPIVLTVDRDSYRKIYDDFFVDEALLNEIPADTDIRFVPSENILNLYNSPLKAFLNIYFNLHSGSESSKWRKKIWPEVEKAVQQFKPKAVFVSVPPFSTMRTGLEISKKFKLPLILDFRDPWLTWRTTPFGSFVHFFLTRIMEEKYIRASDAVITTSDQTILDFIKFHPDIERKKYHFIPNGYDEKITDWSIVNREKKDDTIVIGYVGSFYYDPKAREQLLSPWYSKKINRILQYTLLREDWLYRSPYFFLKAVKRVLEIRPDLKAGIKINFIGEVPLWLPGMIGEYGLESSCQLLGKKTRKESVEFQKQCDFLLLTSSKVLKGDDYSIAGKTFEYFSMRRPILAFVSNGAQKRMILNSGMGLICNPDDPQESAQRMIQLFEGKSELHPNTDFLNSLHRKNLTGKLARVINKVCGSY